MINRGKEEKRGGGEEKEEEEKKYYAAYWAIRNFYYSLDNESYLM